MWVKVDDGFFLHRKVEGLSKDAKLLFIAGLSYCARELTDGFISAGVGLRTTAAMVDVKPAAAQALVGAGLWEKRSDGYDVHDYHDYQPTKAETEERRRIRAAAGRKGGQRSAEARQANGQANASAFGRANAPPNGGAGVQAESNPVSRIPTSLSHPPVTQDPRGNTTAPGGAGEEKMLVNGTADPFVERIVAAVGESPRHRRDAVELIHRARSALDPRHIDEAIGRCEEADRKARSVAFFATTIDRTAAHYGVDVPAIPAASAGA